MRRTATTPGTDYLIVGGGSAGCILASRLSAAGASVHLLEAGPDTMPGHVPADIEDLYPRAYYNDAYFWPGFEADQTEDGAGKRSPFPQARVLGGGSSVMGMVALRGAPEDYDSWNLEEWRWDRVLPAFRQLERDRDVVGALHGSSGPITIRRHRPEEWPPFCRAVGEAATNHGWPMIDDLNGDFVEGYGALPMSSTLSARASSASAFLDGSTRSRPNLRISCDATVLRLLFEGTRCVGVQALHGGALYRHLADRVIVCAGSLNSPALLLRSGIGSRRELEALGIAVVANLPGVGRRLQNHPVVYLGAHLRPEARQSPNLRPAFNTALRYNAACQESTVGELQMLVLNKSSWHGLGSAIAGLGVCLMRPRSYGSVTIVSADPHRPPVIRLSMLSDPVDRERMCAGFEVACDLMRHDAVRQTRNEIFAAGYSRVVRRLNRPGRMNQVAADVIAGALDGPALFRRALIRWGIASGERGDDRLTSASWQQATVSRRAFGTYHVVGTCRMGPEGDSEAVTLADGTVRETEGLSVVDASLFPAIPRANTNLPVQMVAQRCADMILAREAAG